MERSITADESFPLYSLTIEYGLIAKSKRYERSFLVKGQDDAYKVVKPSDFAFNPMNLRFGAIAKHKETFDVAVSKYYNIFFCNQNCNAQYLEYFLRSYKMIQYYNKMSTGTLEEKKRVHYLDFIHFKKYFPSLSEQQKIASFLSAVDEKIQQLTRKKELLEQYKKGVMQQLFSGKLRFKDEKGKEYSEWEEKEYGEVFSFLSTNSFSRDNLNYEYGKVKNIHYGDIHTRFASHFNIQNEMVPFVNSEINIDKIKQECYCQEGDLIIADASEDYADIGKSIELVNLNKEKVVAGLHTFLARPKKGIFYIGFPGHLVKSENVRKQVMTIAQGTKVLSISTGRLGKVKFKIPIIAEQKKIVHFLNSLDEKIKTLGNEIKETQTFKNGLLQQMFV
jgi:type I restriction enzyme S subunit